MITKKLSSEKKFAPYFSYPSGFDIDIRFTSFTQSFNGLNMTVFWGQY